MSEPRKSPPARVLARYACDSAASRGRLHDEPDSPTRTAFQRDRDRIIHSTAFRRLQYKTQVFVYHEGDHYRTRLTHSLEVSQIARSLARGLGLDEDLAEAIALAHDLGHPPFGHAGERALARCMAPHGGFDHNAQSLAVVTALERRYADFEGLNLTWESLEGLVKHNGPLTGEGVPAGIVAYSARHDLELSTQAGAEAQCAALADDIAYCSHDIDDGLRAELFDLDEISGEVPLVGRMSAEVDRLYPGIDLGRRVHEAVRRVIGALIDDTLAETERRLAALAPVSAADIRAAAGAVVALSAAMAQEVGSLRAFLFARMYRHRRVMAEMEAAEAMVEALFSAYVEDPERMPAEWRDSARSQAAQGRARAVADYIAGMTDRYAIAEHARLFDAAARLG